MDEKRYWKRLKISIVVFVIGNVLGLGSLAIDLSGHHDEYTPNHLGLIGGLWGTFAFVMMCVFIGLISSHAERRRNAYIAEYGREAYENRWNEPVTYVAGRPVSRSDLAAGGALLGWAALAYSHRHHEERMQRYGSRYEDFLEGMRREREMNPFFEDH